MERLTKRDKSGKAWAELRTDADGVKQMMFGRKALDRLAAYEATNHTPEECAAAFEELAAYRAAEQDGTLLRLPCKVGDTIIAFRFNLEKGLYFIADKVTSVTTNKNGFTVRTKSKFYPIKEKDGLCDFAPISAYPNALADYYIGSIKAAEAALKEQEGQK